MSTACDAIGKNGDQLRHGVLLGRLLGGPGRFMAWYRKFVRSQLVAEGYEDTEGFHYGRQPHPNCVNLDQYSRDTKERKLFETTRTAAQPLKHGKPEPISVARSDSSVRGRRR